MTRTRYKSVGFQMLTKEAQQQLMRFEYAVIGLMTIIGIVSIVWSMSLHILSGDLYNILIGAKLAFRERDFARLDTRSQLLLQNSLDQLNLTYAPTTSSPPTAGNGISKDGLISDFHVMPPAVVGSTGETSTTAKPKRKIAHIFQMGSNRDAVNGDDDDVESDAPNVTTASSVLFDAEGDLRFLSTMAIDIHHSRWRQSAAVQFIYAFPFWSEIVAIIWIGMCLVYQSGVKKYWGLPKPWRIVVPSICVFTLMTLGSLAYSILAHRFLKDFCTGLRSELSHPGALSCGEAIAVLRPIVRQHVFKHDVYLTSLHFSYLTNLVCWCLALLIVICRYLLAIDFQLVDVAPTYDDRLPREQEFVEVLLSSPQHQVKLSRVEGMHKSEDDFQSAKSHLSEVATPLLVMASNTAPSSSA